MMRIFFILFGFLCFTKATAQEKSLLWKVQSPDKKETSYLFGTIHLIDSSKFYLSDSLKNILDKVETLTLEIDMSNENGMAALMNNMDKLFMTGDTTLETLLSKENYELISRKMEKTGMPMTFLNKLKPIFLYVMISEEKSISEFRNTYKSYELELTEIAKTQNKKFAGLESADFQLSVLNTIPLREQADMLVGVLKENKEEGQLDKMISMYLNEELEEMQDLMKSDPTMLKHNNALLQDRNKDWIPKIKQMMKQSSHLFAVGAGHLGGKEGVVNLLRKAGYILTPIFQDKPKRK